MSGSTSIAGRRYLVTGGTGFIGSGLVKGLLRRGASVRVFDNDSRGSASKLGDAAHAVDLVVGDIRDGAAVRDAMQDIDCVCHLAYVNGTEFFYTKPELVLDVAVKGMVSVIDGAIDAGVKDLVLASSSEVYQSPPGVPTDETVPLSVPDPLNARYSYGGGKIICELMALNYGRRHFERVVIFRPHNVYGPDMGWEHVIPQFAVRLRALRESQPDDVAIDFPIQGSGDETRSFVYIDDAVEGILRVIESGDHLGIYNVGTEEEISIAHLAREVARIGGRDIRLVRGSLQPGGTLRRCPSIAKLAALGFEPRTSLPDGLAETIHWYDAHQPPTPVQ